MPSTPTASIAICCYTHARWGDLLASIASARAQSHAAEVLVVVDHEPTLLARLIEAATGARVIPNDGPRGLSGARNTGLRASHTDVVAFLDDDATAAPGWLRALLAPYDDAAVVATGGRIEPAWDRRRPRWLPPELDWVVGCTYRGLPVERADVRNVIGAGMSVRRAAALAVGGFPTSVGRGRGLPVGGEETALCIALRRANAGARVVYEPRAAVRHRVPAGRASVSYLVRRSWAEGLTKARVARMQGRGDALASERSYVTRTLPRAIVRDLLGSIRRREIDGSLRAAACAIAVAAATIAFALETVRQRVAPRAGDGRSPEARDRSLRILQVTARYDPYVGGIETHTAEVARRLAARGHRVTIATTDPGGNLPRREVRDGVEIRRVRAWPAGRDWYVAPGLARVAVSSRWDVVHLQGIHTFVPLIGAAAALVARIPMVVTLHSGGHSSRLRTALRGLQWRVLAPFIRRAAAVVGVSRFEADRFAGAMGLRRDDVRVIRNGVTPSGSPDDGPAAAVDIGDGPLILSLGRLERYKGHQRAIAAMPALLAMRPSARLHVAGSGPYEAELRRQARQLGVADAVDIGPIPHEDVPAALHAASLVVLLSEYEAHPVAVIEAVSAGRRVLVADTTGFRELAEAGLVRAIPIDASPLDTARAIAEELSAAPRAPMGSPELPTWEETTDAIEDLYRAVVAG